MLPYTITLAGMSARVFLLGLIVYRDIQMMMQVCLSLTLRLKTYIVTRLLAETIVDAIVRQTPASSTPAHSLSLLLTYLE
jgi:hypothetical protein